MKIKINDTVKIIAGKDRGKTGKVVRALPKKKAVIVAGINQVIRHIKPQAGRSGEKRTINKPIDVCKVKLVETGADKENKQTKSSVAKKPTSISQKKAPAQKTKTSKTKRKSSSQTSRTSKK